MSELLHACIAVAGLVCRRCFPHRYPPPVGEVALFLFFGLVIGGPIAAVIWGYATGMLPAPSPHTN